MQEANATVMMELVKYRDAGMSTYTYFWVDKLGRVKSPYFDSEEAAKAWNPNEWDEWKSNRDIT